MKKLILILMICPILCIGIYCATALTPAGNQVKLIMKTEAPSNCELLGDIQTGLGEPDVIGVKNYLRNKTYF